MRRVSYLSVLQKPSQLWTGQSRPSAEDAAALNVFLNFRAGQYWEYFYWPELTPAEKRQFRPDYASGTTYAASSSTAAVERFYPPSGKYYQSLVAGNVGHAPATLSGSTYAENSAYWAESASSYSGNYWLTGTVFALGDKTQNPADQRFYQCIVPHTAGGSFDASKFAILTPFVRNLDYEQSGQTPIGEVKKVWDRDPYVYELSERCEIPFYLTDLGIIVTGDRAIVYPEFRRRVPSWTGSNYDAAATYAALGQVYDPTTGDYYFSIAGANTGQAVTDTTKWTRIDFPYVLRDCVAQAAFADCQRVDGKTDNYMAEIAIAGDMLRREIIKIELKQGQARQLNVRGRSMDLNA